MIEKLFEQHKHCDLTIRFKPFKNQTLPAAGLFCKCHNAFLDWLPQDIAYQLLDEGMEQEAWQLTERQLRKQRAKERNEQNRLRNLEKKQKLNI